MKSPFALLALALVASSFAVCASARPALADGAASTRNIILGAAAAGAGLFVDNNVFNKSRVANTILGHTRNGATVYGDGRVVFPDGRSYYPARSGQTIACRDDRCAIYGGGSADTAPATYPDYNGVYRYNREADRVIGHTPQGATVYADGYVTYPNGGAAYYPVDSRQTVECYGERCEIRDARADRSESDRSYAGPQSNAQYGYPQAAPSQYIQSASGRSHGHWVWKNDDEDCKPR